MIKVLGFGDNVVDKYEHIKTMYPGGNCLNFAVYAKQFGAKIAAYMGIFGDDNEAEHVIESIRKMEVQTIKCRQIRGENGCARVALVDGERVFLGSNEGGIRKEVPYVLDRFDLEYMASFDIIHSGNYSYTEAELPKIKEIGIPISFDFSDDSTAEYYARIAPIINFAFMSCSELTTGEIKNQLERILNYGTDMAIATRGSKGAVVFDGNRFYNQDGLPTTVVDTMGAGDSLISAFVVGYMGRKKQGKITNQKSHQEAIEKSLLQAVDFAGQTCGLDGAFGYGKKY